MPCGSASRGKQWRPERVKDRNSQFILTAFQICHAARLMDGMHHEPMADQAAREYTYHSNFCNYLSPAPAAVQPYAKISPHSSRPAGQTIKEDFTMKKFITTFSILAFLLLTFLPLPTTPNDGGEISTLDLFENDYQY